MRQSYDHTHFTGEEPSFSRVLFLEFDGILNSNEYFAENPSIVTEQLEGVEHPGEIDQPSLLFDPENVQALNRIISAVDPTVVLTSSWRNYYTIEDVESHLEQRGYDGEVDAFIEEGDQLDPAKHEIIMWCEQETSPDEFLVLDTMEFRGIENLRIVDPEKGLCGEDVDAVLDHFGED